MATVGSQTTPPLDAPRANASGDASLLVIQQVASELDFVVSALASQKLFPPPPPTRPDEPAIKDSALMQLLMQVGVRIGQAESDLETTVQETQKLEERLVQRLRQVEDTTVKSSELHTSIGEWFRLERNEALVLTRNLYRVLGVGEDDVQRCLVRQTPASDANHSADPSVRTPSSAVADIEALWRDSNIARSLQYVHRAAAKATYQQHAQGIHAYDEDASMAPHTEHIHEITMDEVGLLPLPARMLGLQLIDEPFAKGPRVRSIIRASGASVSSLAVGNYIIAVNRIPVRNTADVIAALAVVMPGSYVRIDSLTSRGAADVSQIVAGSQRVYA